MKEEEEVIMGSNTPKTKLAQNASDQDLVAGLNNIASKITSFVVGGEPVPTKDIAMQLQARVDTAKAAESARLAWRAAVKADRDERARTKALASVVKQTLLQCFAGQADVLGTFGLTPRNPRVVAPATQVIAAAKARATRAARHTMGRKQKADIVGALDSNVVTIPVPAPVVPSKPAAVAPAPSPAPTPSAPTTFPGTPGTHGS